MFSQTYSKPLGCLLWLALIAPLSAEVTVQGTPEELKAFVTKGQGQVILKGSSSTVVEASEIKAIVKVTSDGPTPGSALTLHEQQKQELLTKLQAVGIPRGQVTVPKFATLTPRYGASGDQAIGHRAESTLTLELSEQRQYVELLAVLDRAREAKLEGLKYDHIQMVNLQKQIALNACKKVTARQEAFEEGLGVKLRAISFTEENSSPRFDAQDGARFGQLTIETSLAVTYVIEPASTKPAEEKPKQP